MHEHSHRSAASSGQSLLHSHQHGMDATLASSARGIRAVKISFIVLALTALLQAGIAGISGSVALLADTVHNFGDAATALPLWIAFALARRRPTARFPYGLGRVEDLAGVTIVFIILASGAVAGYEAVDRILHPQPVRHLGAVIAAAIVGFLGNEVVAVYRIRVGGEIGSAALVADGYHARVDGLTSFAVLPGAVGVYLGFPLADPLVGLAITAVILGIVWQSGRTIFARMLDGVEPGMVEDLRQSAARVPEVKGVEEARARWMGHRLRAEVSIAVEPGTTVARGHAIALAVRRQLLAEMDHLAEVSVRVVPLEENGPQERVETR